MRTKKNSNERFFCNVGIQEIPKSAKQIPNPFEVNAKRENRRV